MLQGQMVVIVVVAFLLLSAGTAEAGWPLGRQGFGRQVVPSLPVPRVIEVPGSVAASAASSHPNWGQTAAPRAYPWGHFGARTRPGFVYHSGYYGDVSNWWQ